MVGILALGIGTWVSGSRLPMVARGRLAAVLDVADRHSVKVYSDESARIARAAQIAKDSQTAPQAPLNGTAEMAEFQLAKPKWLDASALAHAQLYFGDHKVQLNDENGKWSFRLPKDELSSVNRLALQVDTARADFGGEVRIEKVDLTKTNVLPEPRLDLEAIPDAQITLGGRTVGSQFPLSPLQWRGSEERAEIPSEVTGKSALALLGFKSSLATEKEHNGRGALDWRQVPNPGRQGGRYGQWLWLNSIGLALHCRFELDDKYAGKRLPGRKFLPGKDTDGLVEAIRVLTPQAGSVGEVLRVGASRAEVQQTFGAGDDSQVESDRLLGLGTGADRNRNLMGDSKLEAWDSSYMNGGIRIKWEGDRVKWFELARPIQLLYNGTRSFDMVESRRVYIRDIQEAFPNSTSLRAMVEDFLSSSSGVTQAATPDTADLMLNARMNVTSETRWVTHKHTVRVAKKDRDGNYERDDRGNYKYEDKEENECFECPSLHVEATMNVSLGDSEPLYLWRTKDFTARHSEGKKCPFADLIGSEQITATEGGGWRRRFTNLAAEAANVAGTVLGVNYQTGAILINLGRLSGVRTKGDEGTEMEMYLLHSVDVSTGASQGSLEDERIIGPGFREWLEVQEVGPNWCIAIPKVKGAFGRTQTAFNVIPRLIDASSGLVRVKIVPKRG